MLTLFMKDNIIAIFDTYENKQNQHQLYAQKIEKDGNFNGKLVLIDKIESEKKSNSGIFLIWPSEDNSKFLVINNPPFEKYQDEIFNFKVYDSELNNISNIGTSLPYKDKNVSIIDYYLGNDGAIYMLTCIELEKEQREKGQSPYFYSILLINPKTAELSEFKIELSSKNIEEVSFRIDNKNNKLICAGFYSNLKPTEYTGKDIDGFFFLRIDALSKEIEAKGFKEIDKNMVAELSKKKKAEGDKGVSKSFEIVDVVNKSDGSITLISEYQNDYVVYSTTTSSNGVTTTKRTDYYDRNNIFVINVNPDGKVLSLIDIPKKQNTVNDKAMFSSFLLFENADRLFLFYNDHPDNLKSDIKTIKDVTKMPSIRKACLVAVEINKDGSYTKSKIYDNYTNKMAVLPAKSIKIGDSQYVAPIIQLPSSCSCITMFSGIKKGLIRFKQ